MSSPAECPICMEEIMLTKNCVTTECGHCFHTNCLMKSVAHNGFGCPYCRSAMAEAVNDSDDDEYLDEDEDDDDDDEDFDDDDDALRGFRLFFNNINGEEAAEEDIAEEDVMNAYAQEEAEQQRVTPSVAFVTKKLIEQGVTCEQLVMSMLASHAEYESNDVVRRADDDLFGRARVVISNYLPE